MFSFDRVIRLACIGDSISAGIGTTNPAVDSYPARLQELLGKQGFEVREFGWSGAGIMRLNKRYMGSSYCDNALAFNPDIVICNLGINDISADTWGFSREAFTGAYRKLVDAFGRLPTQPLFILWHKITPLFPGQTYHGDPGLPTLNDWIGDSAALAGVSTIDMHELLENHPEWFPDKLHPNDEGARAIAEKTYHFLMEMGVPMNSPCSSTILEGRVSAGEV